MRRSVLPRLLAYVFVLTVPSRASADDSLAAWAQRRVDEGLLKPLARQDQGGGFSRRRPPPRQRRARVLDASLIADKSGRSFVRFAVDVRFGSEWHENDVLGCVYRESGDLFVKAGDAYRPAAFLLGEKAEPVAGACEAAPPVRS
jgi:hypothetical protein